MESLVCPRQAMYSLLSQTAIAMAFWVATPDTRAGLVQVSLELPASRVETMIQPAPGSTHATTMVPLKTAIVGLKLVYEVGPGTGWVQGPGKPVEPFHWDHQICPEESAQAA